MIKTKRHHDAFLFYYELGDKRTLARVGQEVGVTTHTIERWSIAFNWQKRVQEKDKRISVIQEKKQENTIAKRKVDYQTVLQGTIAQYIQRVKGEPHICPHCKGKIKMPKMTLTPKDFELMVKLDLLLSGEATDISLVKVDVVHKAMNTVVMIVANYIPADKLIEFRDDLIKLGVVEDE